MVIFIVSSFILWLIFIAIIYTIPLKFQEIIYMYNYKIRIKYTDEINNICCIDNEDVKSFFHQILYLNTRKKIKIMLLSLSLSYLFGFSENPVFNDSLSEKLVIFIFIIILLYIVGNFIKYDNGKFFYLIKLLILIIYLLIFLSASLINIDNILFLLLAVMVSFAYSIFFIKNVIDSFEDYYFFQLLNIVSIILILNFLVGTFFGMFYLQNYQFFDYFTLEEYNALMKSANSLNLFYISVKGLVPVYDSFPMLKHSPISIKSFLPTLEFFIGYLFNLLIIGFIVSYSVTKSFNNKLAIKK